MFFIKYTILHRYRPQAEDYSSNSSNHSDSSNSNIEFSIPVSSLASTLLRFPYFVSNSSIVVVIGSPFVSGSQNEITPAQNATYNVIN